MQLTNIVVIVLRITALSWLVHGLTGLAAVAIAHPDLWNYAVPAIFFVFAAIVWFLAAPIARLVTPRSESVVSIGTLSRYDLYCFAFVWLGLNFVLSSLADAVNWLHYYFTIARLTYENDPQRQQGFYQLSKPLITVIAGGLSLLFAARCAKKLTDVERKHEGA
jgi:hypothetical protein